MRTTPPSFGDRPPIESTGARWRIRAVALAAVAASVMYLIWRAAATLDLTVWWLSLPLLALEVHAVAGLALFTFSLWDVDSAPAVKPRSETDLRIAVLIPTYDEPVEVLLPTVAAAVALSPAHETWVLDDGARPEVARLAQDLGAHYRSRTERNGAKAGNLNAALFPLHGPAVDADVVAVLDADHVAAPEFLTATLGYFDDPRLAVVQTPQDFYNVDSFEHEQKRQFSEQALFYRVIQPGKNRWGAAFWCGTGALVRVSALRQVGGVATDTLTEDIHTTIRLHRAGWRTVYHNEVLTKGLAAADAGQYALQRKYWGTGAMQVLRVENPLTVPGLRPAQRLAYAATLLGWFDSWRSLGYLVVPPLVLLTGAVPIRAEVSSFLFAFTVVFCLQRLALLELGRNRAPQVLSTVFELVRMPANLAATMTLLRRSAPGGRQRRFAVTPEGRTADDRSRRSAPVLLHGLQWACALAGAYAALSFVGLTPTSYTVPAAAWGALVWLGVNGSLLTAAVRRIEAERFAGERRASVRFEVDVDAVLGDFGGRVADLSLTGASVLLPAVLAGVVEVGDTGPLRFDLSGPHPFTVAVRSVRLRPDGTVAVGVEFDAGQDNARANLALALFHAGKARHLVLVPDGPAVGVAA